MDTELEPVIDSWYQHTDNQLHFCIIDIDDLAGLLEIQHANGDLDTMDIDTWYESGIKLATEPDHWSTEPDDSISDDDNDSTREAAYLLEKLALSGQQNYADHAAADNRPDAIDERIMLNTWQDETLTI